jgi:hypothetical protein
VETSRARELVHARRNGGSGELAAATPGRRGDQQRQGRRATASGTSFRAVVAGGFVIELHLAISSDELVPCEAFVLDALREASIPVAIAMAGGYVEKFDDVVDIQFTAATQPLSRLSEASRSRQGTSLLTQLRDPASDWQAR